MDDRDLRLQQRRAKRRRNELIVKCIISLLVLVVVFLAVILIKDVAIPELTGKNRQTRKNTAQQLVSGAGGENRENNGGTQNSDDTGAVQAAADGSEEELIAYADYLAAQYDYDGAIAYLRSSPAYTGSQALQDAVSGYENTKATCTAYPLDQITHVFFHTMIKDTSKAFDGDSKEGGYNQVMTTMDEFAKIMEQMYAEGYVMVSLHDMCIVNDDGTVSRGEILLPPGKKPFVLSQDDVSYYHYMDGDGFAQKLIVDENGEVKNTYVEDDGSISVGDYDMVPWIDSFVKEHPDFSYHGHKGIIALTGYEGVLGYRTDEVYRTKEASRVTEYQQKFFDEHPDFDEASWQNEVDQAKAVASAMRAEGWEFASHTWGHISPTQKGIDGLKQDTERWLNNVETIVGDTDVIIFAFGADIGDWQPYTSDNEYFAYLKEQGFNIYCNVDSSQYWVQFGDNYMRQGRRNLDGYRMYYNPEMLSDLFTVSEVWDSSRPTPVPQM
ncbi:MAG: polysaccharide deacetylase [Candidatus Choladocola sp.]|nr:polysaccharide deacetylase [Candidatus Choladocola sp.]